MRFDTVQKETFDAVIFTKVLKVVGSVHVLPQERLTDFLGTATPQFLPITDAKIFTVLGDQLIEKTRFLNLNKQEIVAIYPISEIEE